MTFRGLLFVAVAALVLPGCASLPNPFASRTDAAAGPSGAASAPEHAEYRLEVDAPGPLKTLLVNYLDLSRFQNAPSADAIDSAELERLVRAAPAQARGLLETEGYFNAVVTVEKEATTAGGLPLLRMKVDPGVQARVAATTFEASGELQTAAQAGDPAAAREIAGLRLAWPLRPGDTFRQPAWDAAKNTSIAKLRAEGYAAATWRETHADVDAPANEVRLQAVADSGPLFRLGPIRIEGLSRYDAESVTRLATFNTGTPYTEKALLDFQERLQKLGLFEGASVVLDPALATHEAAPVIVKVKEQPLQQATLGVGFSADTGARFTLDHTQRRVFGTPWIARNKFELGPANQSWVGELTSHPLENLWRNILGGSAARLTVVDQVQTSASARVGRTQESPTIDRLYYAEVTDARVASDTLRTEAKAVSGNYRWVFRHLDNVLAPTRGTALNAQAAVGYGDGSSTGSASTVGTVSDHGPFARAYSRLSWYKPLPGGWFGNLRIEGGQVFTTHPVAVPDTFLFRAGGEDSVRGYGYRTLGPTVDGVVTSGRVLLTGSAEVARPISPRLPDYLYALFIDAGNAADRWSTLHPAVGYGVGLRWRSPVGPLRIDLAYGQQVHQVRVDFSVGVVF